jgi:DoxX-like protein
MSTNADAVNGFGVDAAQPSRKMLWAGRIVTALPVLFLLFDALGKFVKPQPVVEGTLALGYQESVIIPLGIILAISTILYAIPRTTVLGAVLLTGYLGGAIATHVRVGNPLFTHTLFPVYLGILIWLGIYLRDSRLRSLLPFGT